jgi:hypothetical protein
MDMMNEILGRRVVAIGWRGKGAKTWALQGSGCLVAEDRVLTAHHAIFSRKNDAAPWVRVPVKELAVALPADDGKLPPADDWKPLRGVAWHPPTKVPGSPDIAVLRTRTPVKRGLWTLGAPAVGLVPAARSPWNSRGFPVFAGDNAFPASGTVCFDPSGFALNCDSGSAPNHSGDSWKGMSGAPIVVHEKLVGVVANYELFSPGRLYGVPLVGLLADQSFCAAIGLCSPDARSGELLARLEERFRACLDGNKALSSSLKQLVGQKFPTSLVDASGGTRSVSDAVLALDCIDGVRILTHIYGAVRNIGDHIAAADAEKLLGYNLSIRYDFDGAQTLAHSVDGGVRVMEVPASRLWAVETKLAARMGVPAKFRPKGNDCVGKNSVGAVESGVDPGGKNAAAEIVTSVAEKLGWRKEFGSASTWLRTKLEGQADELDWYRSPIYLLVVHGSEWDLRIAEAIQGEYPEFLVARARPSSEATRDEIRIADLVFAVIEHERS